MKKLFTLLLCSVVLFSCSTEDNSEVTNNETALSFEDQLASGALDNSSLGIYKGLFTTLDGQNRATIMITLNGISAPTAEFLLPTGDKNIVRASENIGKSQLVDGLSFNEGDFKFEFNVNKDGSNPTITNITYMGKDGDAIMAKETSKSALSTKTGTYTCETGCFTDEEDTKPHPELGRPGAVQTFNFMSSDGGSGPLTMQFTLNSPDLGKYNTYTGTATQENCRVFDDGPRENGYYNICFLRAQPDLNGRTGPIRFRSSVSATESEAFHIYDNDSAGDSYECSTYEGVAYYNSTVFGRATISFSTDNPTEDGGDCVDLNP